MSYIYDNHGHLVGTVSNYPRIPPELERFINRTAMLYAIGMTLLTLLVNYQSLPAPYNYVAGYYFYLLAFPLLIFKAVWIYFGQITHYPNLNIIIACAAVAFYGLVCLPIYALTLLKILDIFRLRDYWRAFLFAPGVFVLASLVIMGIFQWLFVT